ncbi:MAG: pilus assembly protein N-terminal domain-containing protein [Oligoflexia bacterium]|nr:pilus assembly protein N-terminal domain-containing protein [Oligoflexia bacterium]
MRPEKVLSQTGRARPGRRKLPAVFGLLALLAAVAAPLDSARTEEGAEAASGAPGTAATGGPAAAEAEEAPAPSKPKKNPYRKSRLTRDESEGVSDKRRLLLSTGEDKAVDIDFDLRADAIVIGNPQVVATTVVQIGEQKQLIFKPLKAGDTTVTARDQAGNIRLIFTVRVTGSNLLRASGEIRNLLRDIEGIDIRVVGQKVVIEGEVLVPADYDRLLTVVQDRSYADLVLNLTTLSPLAMQVLAKRIQDDINMFAKNVRTRVVNGMIFLEGAVDSKDEADRALTIANLYLPELKPGTTLDRDSATKRVPLRKAIYSFLTINPPPGKKQEKMVRVTVHFVELAKDYARLFGFKWQPGFTADPKIEFGTNQSGAVGTGGSAAATFSGTISSLLPKLQSAQKAGYARVLKTGTLIVRSGQAAKINEGTEFPYMVQGANGQVQAASKGVGLAVAVTPAILGQSEDVALDINMSQTNVVGRVPSGTAPVTSKHDIETRIYVKNRETAAIAAVTSSDVGTDFNKDDPNPGAFEGGDTHALFSLLRSKNYRKKKSQFVIFVTPEIVENASDGTEDLRKNFRVKVK